MEENRDPRNNPHIYGQLTFNEMPGMYNRESIISSTFGIGKTEYTHAKD